MKFVLRGLSYLSENISVIGFGSRIPSETSTSIHEAQNRHDFQSVKRFSSQSDASPSSTAVDFESNVIEILGQSWDVHLTNSYNSEALHSC